MVRLTRIYTKTGDDGSTGLADGSRVGKDALRIDAYGDVDELNAVLGLLREAWADERVEPWIAAIQNDLFDLGADLATPGDGEGLRVTAAQVSALEAKIDEINADLAPLESFVLPGGTEASGWLHLARTVCRRAERNTVRLSREETIGSNVIPYLNRLSDLLFVLARHANDQGAKDVLWEPGKHRGTDSDDA